MLTRRSVIALINATTVLVAAPSLVRNALAQPTQHAAIFVGSTADQLVGIANSSDQPLEKRRRLQQVINANVDVDDIARFCLGRFWRVATPEQQQEYAALFNQLLVTKIADHVGEYRGVRLTMGTSRPAEDTDIVQTTIEQRNGRITRVDWVVRSAAGAPKIIDLLAEGTSLRLTQSSDFVAYLARHQYDVSEFIKALRQIVARNG